ncbi:MAG TPA: exosome subunit [Archaeoglobaceae archaeon]|nr:exosome subunit [Archaeoglobaceae archaeon]
MKIEKIVVSAVIHSTESQEKVLKALKSIFPFEPEFDMIHGKGHYGNPITYVKSRVSDKKKVEKLWSSLIKKLESQKNALIDTADKRLDEDNFLHIRIDKQKAYEGKLELTEGSDAIILRAKIVSFPSKREHILKNFKSLLKC